MAGTGVTFAELFGAFVPDGVGSGYILSPLPIATYLTDDALTYSDLVYRQMNRRGIQETEMNFVIVRVAIADAFSEMSNLNEWRFYNRRMVLVTDPVETFEDAEYDSSNRTLTISTGEWPENAELGDIIYGRQRYRIQTRSSDTVLVLSRESAPTASFTADVSWKRGTYTLPYQIRRINTIFDEVRNYELMGMNPERMLMERRVWITGSYPLCYSVRPSSSYTGLVDLEISPIPATATRLELSLIVRPKALSLFEKTGTDGAATSGGYVFTSAAGGFTDDMIGTVLRISPSSSLPKGKAIYASTRVDYSRQYLVDAVPSATQLHVTTPFPATISGKGFVVSDLVDINRASMLSALEGLSWAKFCLNQDSAKEFISISNSVAKKEMDAAMNADSTYSGQIESPMVIPWSDIYRVGTVSTR